MYWLPTAGDFQALLKDASADSNRKSQFEKLKNLARHNLSYRQSLQLNAAIVRYFDKHDDASALKLAMLSSGNIDHLLPFLRVSGLSRGYEISLYSAPYAQYRQEIFNSSSSLNSFRADAAVLSLSAQELLSGIPITASNNEVDWTIDKHIEGLRNLWEKMRETHRISIVIQQTFLNVSDKVFGNFDRFVTASPQSVLAKLNQKVCDAASEAGVIVLDLEQNSTREGTDFWFDLARWYQAKMEISPTSASRYADLVTRLLDVSRGASKKCLVLDLDNTLWGGVVGDDGLHGIVLGEGTATGEAFLSFQKYVKILKERGVVLAICSKNEATLVEDLFRTHPDMVLQREDFAAIFANWDDKAENIQRIAEALNIGVDAIVFVDDNPAERLRVRTALPEVSVPELPTDPSKFSRCLSDAGYFDSFSFTDEDRTRSDQYTSIALRESLREASSTVEDYLESLEMNLIYGRISKQEHSRVVQLVNKTNQFNTTTQRITNQQLVEFCKNGDNLALYFRLTDKFGDNGLVSVMLLAGFKDDRTRMKLENWVMSCRVFGRQLENKLMNVLVAELMERGGVVLEADFIRTERNGVIRNLFEKLGFSLKKSTGSKDSWTLQLSEHMPGNTFISLAKD